MAGRGLIERAASV